MRALELIARLQDAVNQYGDLEIEVRDAVNACVYGGISVSPDPATPMEQDDGAEGTIDLYVTQ